MRLIMLIIISSLSISAQSGIRSGFWYESILPSKQEAAESCLGGYGAPFSRCGILDVHSDISVRALSLSQGHRLAIFAVLDTIGVGDSIIADIKQHAHTLSRGEISPSDIYITATHTHSGPDLQGLWGGISVEYRDRIVRLSARAILNAYLFRSNAIISTWHAQADVENRRGWDIVDRSINVMDIRSKRYGHRISTLINMSAHPTIIDETDLVYSADYVDALRRSFEHKANTNVVFINGIVGDAQAATNGQRGTLKADEFGAAVASRAWENREQAKPLRGRLNTYGIPFSHPIENPLILGALEAGLLDLEVNDDMSISTQIGLITIGRKFSALIFPGEALSRLGVPLKSTLPGVNPFFFGLSGDSLGYFIPSDEFLAIPGRSTEEAASLSPLIGDKIVEKIENALKH